jgi:dephospho-CoA kinase
MTKPVIGLVGGMGSGKSLVASLLEERGAKVISGDRLGHEALGRPDVKERLTERWGREILDERGEISRRRVAGIVFADPTERHFLEKVVFPWIERRLTAEIAKAKEDPGTPWIVLDAAIMLESGWNKACDRLVFVDSLPEIRLQRLALDRGWSAEEVQARESAQMPLEEKKRRADFVIDNSGSMEELARQVDDLLGQWK